MENNLDRLLKSEVAARDRSVPEMSLAAQNRVLSALRRGESASDISVLPLLWKAFAAACAVTAVIVSVSLRELPSEAQDDLAVDAEINSLFTKL